jgi:hypothetical protein
MSVKAILARTEGQHCHFTVHQSRLRHFVSLNLENAELQFDYSAAVDETDDLE